MSLQLHLMGRPELFLNGRPIHSQLPGKACALFYFLAVTHQPHTRSKLASVFWNAMPEERARNNLSIALTKLKQHGLGDYLGADRQYIAFQLNTTCYIDVFVFESLASQPERHTHHQRQKTAQLYRGEFLDDFLVGNEDDVWQFNDWVQRQRARLQPLALKLFYQLAVYEIEQRDHDAALAYVTQQLTIEPWHEEAHRQKMWLLSLQGQRDQAIAQYLLCRRVLVEELAVEPSSETKALYQQILQGDVSQIKFVHTSVPFQAPALSSHFVGHENNLIKLATQLTELTAPRLALVGMGGIGKTTLASQIAHQLRHYFCDGVLWAHADKEDLLAVLEEWGLAYGFDWSQITEFENRAAAFRDLLADKQVLIVLDDLLLVELVRKILPNTSGCAVLITTRDHDVAYALDAQLIEVNVLAEAESMHLLQHIIGPDRLALESDAAKKICKMLENLPLALEIIGQRLRSRPRWLLHQLVEELTNIKSRLEALQLKDRAVRASFEISWQLLDENLSQVFVLLALFAGRVFTSDAVADIADLENRSAVENLEALVALSLVTHANDTHYRQHALLADFALEKIVLTPDLYVHARERMITYYLHFARQFQDDYDALRLEWPNLYAAIQAAYDLQHWQRVYEYTNVLTPAWFTRARYSEARIYYPLGLAAAQQLNDNKAIAHTLLSWSRACIEQGDHSEASEKLVTGLELFRAIDDQYYASEIMLDLGRIAIEESQLEEAHQWLMDARSIKEELNDLTGMGTVSYRIARLHSRVGDWVAAQKKALEALAFLENENQDQVLTLSVLRMLVFVLFESGEHDEAQLHCDRALELARQLENKDELATTLYNALLIAARRDFTKAVAYADECMPLFESMGAIKMMALTHYELAIAHWHRDDLSTALDLARQGLEKLRTIEEEYNQVNVLFFIGLINERQGEIASACQSWQAALSLAVPQRHKLTERIQECLRAQRC